MDGRSRSQSEPVVLFFFLEGIRSRFLPTKRAGKEALKKNRKIQPFFKKFLFNTFEGQSADNISSPSDERH